MNTTKLIKGSPNFVDFPDLDLKAALLKSLNLFFKIQKSDLILLDHRGKTLLISDSMRDFLGIWTPEDRERSILEWIHPEDMRKTLKAFTTLPTIGAADAPFTCRLLATNGEYIPFLWNIQIDETSEWIYAALEKTSTPPLPHWSTETENQNILLSARQASLIDMAAGVAHEINNPLTIILGHIKTLHLAQNDPEKLSKKILTMEHAIERISDIVSALKRFSHKSEHHVSSSHPIGKLIRTAMLAVQPFAKNCSTRLEIEGPQTAILDCYDLDIIQVLISLFRNGIAATQDLPERWVKMLIQEESQHIIIKVYDSSEGIPSSVRSKSLEPFFTTKPMGEPSGLGLTIIQSVLKEHQGSLAIDDSDKKMCLILTLPKMQQNPPALNTP